MDREDTCSSTEKKICPLFVLPNNVAFEVATFLDSRDLEHFKDVSRVYRGFVAGNERLWRKFARTHRPQDRFLTYAGSSGLARALAHPGRCLHCRTSDVRPDPFFSGISLCKICKIPALSRLGRTAAMRKYKLHPEDLHNSPHVHLSGVRHTYLESDIRRTAYSKFGRDHVENSLAKAARRRECLLRRRTSSMHARFQKTEALYERSVGSVYANKVNADLWNFDDITRLVWGHSKSCDLVFGDLHELKIKTQRDPMAVSQMLTQLAAFVTCASNMGLLMPDYRSARYPYVDFDVHRALKRCVTTGLDLHEYLRQFKNEVDEYHMLCIQHDADPLLNHPIPSCERLSRRKSVARRACAWAGIDYLEEEFYSYVMTEEPANAYVLARKLARWRFLITRPNFDALLDEVSIQFPYHSQSYWYDTVSECILEELGGYPVRLAAHLGPVHYPQV